MFLKEYVKFSEIDFNQTELPEYIISIKKEYNDALRKSNYILSQQQYNEYAAKWARIYDWLTVQHARARYLKKSLEIKTELILMREKIRAPEECKSDRAREKWVMQNSKEYQEAYEMSALAEGFYDLFDGEKEAALLHHYNCKAMSSSIDSDKGIGSFGN